MSKRNSKRYPFKKSEKEKLLIWASSHRYYAFLNGNEYQTLNGAFPNIIFVGRKSYLESNENSFEKLDDLMDQSKEWRYGYFSYDLKNEIEDLSSLNPSTIPFDHVNIMVPESIIFINDNDIVIESFRSTDEVFNEIMCTDGTNHSSKPQIDKPTSKTTKKQYIDRVEKIKHSIIEGEFYEMNYCVEYTTKCISFDPLHCYTKLNEISPMPFSSFMRIGQKYLICASPERFLKKEGDAIISQPIKGTIKRSFDKDEDELLKQTLYHSEKERAENLMIVDLVRNDLAKSSETGSVKVDELFGMYTFKKVHQMISTVSSSRKKSISIPNIIKHAFPMGSMTGAPKIRVMKEIDQLEDTSRGLYSGAVGYFTPDQNFDFNVVIRSIIFDAESGKISFHVGSAITFDSDPEYEYNECLLKAESLFEVLSN